MSKKAAQITKANLRIFPYQDNYKTYEHNDDTLTDVSNSIDYDNFEDGETSRTLLGTFPFNQVAQGHDAGHHHHDQLHHHHHETEAENDNFDNEESNIRTVIPQNTLIS